MGHHVVMCQVERGAVVVGMRLMIEAGLEWGLCWPRSWVHRSWAAGALIGWGAWTGLLTVLASDLCKMKHLELGGL